MKRFALFIMATVVAIALCDQIVGVVADYMNRHAHGGYTELHHRIRHEINDDVLIMGASVAVNNYDPQIFEDTLGMSCFDCGRQANGIFLMYSHLSFITRRYSPKLIIYDISPEYDLDLYISPTDSTNRNLEHLLWLRPELHDDAVKAIFRDISMEEYHKMHINTCRYNGLAWRLFSDFLFSAPNNDKGHEGLDGHSLYDSEYILQIRPFDPIKLNYWDKFITLCREKGIQMVFVMSPIHGNSNSHNQRRLLQFASQYGIPVISHVTDNRFNQRKDIFWNTRHLNSKGAEIYSRQVASEIKQLLNAEQDSVGALKYRHAKVSPR